MLSIICKTVNQIGNFSPLLANKLAVKIYNKYGNARKETRILTLWSLTDGTNNV